MRRKLADQRRKQARIFKTLSNTYAEAFGEK